MHAATISLAVNRTIPRTGPSAAPRDVVRRSDPAAASIAATCGARSPACAVGASPSRERVNSFMPSALSRPAI